MGNFDAAIANGWLDTTAAAVWVQLHTGDPGGSGTSNVAAETTRKQAIFGTPAASGAISNTAIVEWASVSTTETYTYVSLWTASTSGTFIGSDDITSAAVTAGDTFRIPIGDLDLAVATVI